MNGRAKPEVEFLAKQIRELKIIQPHLVQAVNAVLAKEQFHKWKTQVLAQIEERLGPDYRQRLSKDWVDTAFAGGDMYDELSDDIEMCMRQLYKLSSEIDTGGVRDRNADGPPGPQKQDAT